MKSGRTRRALLDAGLEVVSEKGYQASTFESIADRFGVTAADPESSGALIDPWIRALGVGTRP